MWINAAGERFWVKYHFKTDQGIEFFTQDEADQMAVADTDYHQRDLYEHIERGEFPSWTLHVQIMPFEEAKTYRFNPFDLTKVWPHGDYPLHEVGRLTLEPQRHRLPHRDGAGRVRAEQPGARTGLSPDKMLLARGFSYADAHRARLGVNYKQIPVNSPQGAACTRYSKDGAMRVVNVADPVYAPNSYGGPQATRDDPSRHVVLGRRDGARGLHAARRGRRLGPGRHDGARGAGRRHARPAGRATSSGHLLQRRRRARPRPRLRVLAQVDRQGHRVSASRTAFAS